MEAFILVYLSRSNNSLGSMLENERGKNLQILLYLIRMVD